MNFSLPSTTAPTSAPPPPPATRELPALQRPGSSPIRRKKGPSGGRLALYGLTVVLVACGVLAFAVPGVSKQMKPLTTMFAGPTTDVITYVVKPANLPVTVT